MGFDGQSVLTDAGTSCFEFSGRAATLWHMEEARSNQAVRRAGRQGFPRMRPSGCARQSLEAELARLRRMSIEERMDESLAMKNLIEQFKPTPMDA